MQHQSWPAWQWVVKREMLDSTGMVSCALKHPSQAHSLMIVRFFVLSLNTRAVTVLLISFQSDKPNDTRGSRTVLLLLTFITLYSFKSPGDRLGLKALLFFPRPIFLCALLGLLRSSWVPEVS
jgi:hypothetical protein